MSRQKFKVALEPIDHNHYLHQKILKNNFITCYSDEDRTNINIQANLENGNLAAV